MKELKYDLVESFYNSDDIDFSNFIDLRYRLGEDWLDIDWCKI